MKVIVTCGPAYAPIDAVRRITNASTGELGVLLANELTAAGFDVICFKGEGATFPGPLAAGECRSFSTNEDLLRQLGALAGDEAAAVFHAAALCDFRVKQARDEQGRMLAAAKFSSRAGALTLELEPAAKVIAELRGLFTRARIVGWKHEMDGGRQDALAKGWRQMRENRTDACVVNGRAYGAGFGVCLPPDRAHHLPDKRALAKWLTEWLRA